MHASTRFVPGVEGPEDPSEVLWFVFRGRDLLLTSGLELPGKEILDRQSLDPERTVYLGRQGETHCYAAQISRDASAPPGTKFENLMTAHFNLDAELAQLAGRAVQLVEWDRTHVVCGACGTQTERSTVERARSCPACELLQFPRLSPAMIVAVERDDQLLMGRAANFPNGIFSVLAGFVEPGESAEEAVVREVWEEAGIEVEDVRYFGSQPWPFPNSLMLGFQARHASGEIKVDGEEIIDAKWFRADAMPNYWKGSVSIAQWLINDFLERNGGG